MRKLFQIILPVAIIGGFIAYHFLPLQTVSEETVEPGPEVVTSEPKLETDKKEIASVREPIAEPAELTRIEQQPQFDESELNAGHADLTALINEYDQVLHDPEAQREIKKRAAQIAEGYKQQVLAKVKSLK